MAFFDFLARVISILLDAISLAMIIRMLLPLFKNPEESRLYLFVAYVTEPFIVPVRFLLDKFNILQNSPIDWSFTITYFLLFIVGNLLPAV